VKEKITTLVEIKKVGVVGCGQMGGGIVQICAQSGYEVLVSEINDDLLKKGLASIKSSLEKSVQKERITKQDCATALAHIKGTTDTEDFADCDLIIEAAVENLELKKNIFSQIDRACQKHTILATNTSCLPVSEIASVTARTDRVLGMHFFNPVPVMKLLEIIKTKATSNSTIEKAKTFGESLGKTVVIVQDTPGFIVNRLMVPQILNAISMVESGTATKEDVDTGMTLGLNQPIGPLALADLIGLDTLLAIADGIHNKLKEKQYLSPPLLRNMVAAGHLGRKTGRGFYEYK
jgi:3-hydroxybutyryl-CoA dehydrogenase